MKSETKKEQYQRETKVKTNHMLIREKCNLRTLQEKNEKKKNKIICLVLLDKLFILLISIIYRR